MASNKTGADGELKYLGFIREIAIQAIVCVLSMYEWAKQHSGPFKFFIRTGERVAILVLRPIYNRVKGFPDQVLLYIDNKVDKVRNKLEEIAPVLANKLMSRLEPVAGKAIQIAQNLIQEAITSGVIAALRYATTESMQLLPNPLNTISNLSDVTTKGLSVLGNVPLVPTNLFKKPDEDANATSAEADPKED